MLQAYLIKKIERCIMSSILATGLILPVICHAFDATTLKQDITNINQNKYILDSIYESDEIGDKLLFEFEQLTTKYINECNSNDKTIYFEISNINDKLKLESIEFVNLFLDEYVELCYKINSYSEQYNMPQNILREFLLKPIEHNIIYLCNGILDTDNSLENLFLKGSEDESYLFLPRLINLVDENYILELPNLVEDFTSNNLKNPLYTIVYGTIEILGLTEHHYRNIIPDDIVDRVKSYVATNKDGLTASRVRKLLIYDRFIGYYNALIVTVLRQTNGDVFDLENLYEAFVSSYFDKINKYYREIKGLPNQNEQDGKDSNVINS